ncbi:MAG TPA: hypothetical protein VES73_00095 [Lamprocystis sp. (in: g-proteobacteria)]|nr:hypothetical protein [Lamprocystis sp. (in: g-proteobacteria)]
MSDERFDLSYLGLIAEGADPTHTRQRLCGIFKLTDKGADRLFTGRPVIVKRDVDAATAARFKKVFAQAGAILTITPVAAAGGPGDDDPMAGADGAEPARVRALGSPVLSLAPPSGDLEEPPIGGGVNPDISGLSLVPGDDWTLEDCAPPATPTPEPDISKLSLVPLPVTSEPEQQTNFLA